MHKEIIFLLVELIKVLGQISFENRLRNNRIKGFGKSLKVPSDNLRLSSITVSFVFIGSIRNIVFGEIVDEGKWTKIYSYVGHAHIISVKNTMNETINLPVGD